MRTIFYLRSPILYEHQICFSALLVFFRILTDFSQALVFSSSSGPKQSRWKLISDTLLTVRLCVTNSVGTQPAFHSGSTWISSTGVPKSDQVVAHLSTMQDMDMTTFYPICAGTLKVWRPVGRYQLLLRTSITPATVEGSWNFLNKTSFSLLVSESEWPLVLKHCQIILKGKK